MAYPWIACVVDVKKTTRASHSPKPCVNRSSGSKVIAIGSWYGRWKNWLEPILQPALAQLSLILTKSEGSKWLILCWLSLYILINEWHVRNFAVWFVSGQIFSEGVRSGPSQKDKGVQPGRKSAAKPTITTPESIIKEPNPPQAHRSSGFEEMEGIVMDSFQRLRREQHEAFQILKSASSVKDSFSIRSNPLATKANTSISPKDSVQGQGSGHKLGKPPDIEMSEAANDSVQKGVSILGKSALDGAWDEAKLGSLLPDDIVRRIVAIAPPSPWKNSDHLAWSLTSDRAFSVKSAYKLLTNDAEDSKIFDLVWSWKGLEQIRTFL
ncbi:hypothetical protein PIB30_015482 [Stylosanthes scabra]|uniref:Uncharacterized protein n=1 Tax=Stylosanthes scabra TaxID=79078 RepID=A0ABU6W8V7_9FABA|nr:hypothetical protein [Stylosanthes scabra]